MDLKTGIKIAQIVGPIILIAVIVCGYFHLANVKDDRDRYKRERNEARQQVIDLDEENQLAYEVADELEKETASVRAASNSLMRRLRDNATVCVTKGETTGSGDAAAGGQVLSGVVGIQAVELVQKFTACDINTERLIAAQAYIRNVCMKTN